MTHMEISEAFIKQLIELTIQIQQIPAPTFSEGKRGAFIHRQFQLEGLSDTSIDEIGNVYARLPGQGATPPLIITAHTDTVFPEPTDLKIRRDLERIFGPGIGDNSVGVAALFGLIWALIEKGIITPRSTNKDDKLTSSLPGDIWLVANVREEGLGDLQGMRAVVERFGNRIIAYLILEGLALGHIYHRGIGVHRYRITFHTPGGHSWVDYGQPSAIHELARLVTALAEKSLPKHPRTTLNVGVVSGGTTINTIAAEASMELDLRSESAQTLNSLKQQVERLIKTHSREKVQIIIETIGARPPGIIPASHPLTKLVRRTLTAQNIRPQLVSGSTDANLPLSLGLPAVCIGLTEGGFAHTTDEYLAVSPLKGGLQQLVSVVQDIFTKLA